MYSEYMETSIPGIEIMAFIRLTPSPFVGLKPDMPLLKLSEIMNQFKYTFLKC
jgi:hypothetical protein